MLFGRDDLAGNRYCDGTRIVSGSHSLKLGIPVVMSVMGSKMHPHLLGYSFPPVNRKAINKRRKP